MEQLFTISVIICVIIAVILSLALHRQTKRADRAEAALAKLNGTAHEQNAYRSEVAK